MRNWIFTPAGAACYMAASFLAGIVVAYAVRQPAAHPVFASYCHLHQISADRCERLYYARNDVTWLADTEYGYGKD